MNRFRVQLVRDLGMRYAVVWDAGAIAAEDEQRALLAARARLPGASRLATCPFTRWRIVPVAPTRSAGRPLAAVAGQEQVWLPAPANLQK